MIFLYSGADDKGIEQNSAELSLGGDVSSSIISNDLLQNIFSEASYLSIQQNKRETKLIVLKNESLTQAASAISITFLLNNKSIGKYKVAFVEPNEEGCFERITSSDAIPYNASFQDIESNIPVTLPDLAKGKYIGIWLTRNYDFRADDLKSKSCQDFADELDESVSSSELNLNDTLDLKIIYTLS